MPVSGGTLANLAGLWCARNRVFGFEPETAGSAEYDGLARVLQEGGWERAVVIGSAMAHYSLKKAVGILGMGRSGYLEAEVDQCGRVCVKSLQALLRECRLRRWRVIAIVGIAGNTDCGAIDPLEAIADLCGEARIHFHVDGAWIAPWVLSDRFREMVRGIERADSVSLDGHKQLHHPIGSSLLLWRDPASSGAIRQEADYMARRESWDQGRFTLEGSRPASILYFHASLRLNGASGFDALVRQNLERTQLFRDLLLASPDFELLVEPITNVVVYRYLPPEFRGRAGRDALEAPQRTVLNEANQAIQERQARLGRTFVSRTCLRRLPQAQGQPLTALRAVLTNPLTSEADLQAVLNDQRAIAKELEEESVVNR